MPGEINQAVPPDKETGEQERLELPKGEMDSYLLAAIIESAEDAIVSKTLEGRITSWNKGAEQLFGYTAEEAIGQPVTMLIPEGHYDEEPNILARIRRGERVEHYETVRIRKDGQMVNVSLTVSPVRGAGGKIIGASKIARDITKLKEAEARLRESEARFSKAFNASPLVLTISSLETGKLLEVNETFVKVTGLTREEAIGQTTLELGLWAQPRDREEEMEAIRQLGLVRNAEHLFRLRNGTEIVGLLSAEQIEIGGRPFALTVIQDITEQKRSEKEREELLRHEQIARQQAEDASRLKEEFLATVSHELRTPLTSILGWAHMLRTQQMDADSTTKALQTVERNARAQAQLIDDLLDVSRVMTGKLRLDVRSLDPHSFIQAAIESAQPAAEAKGVRIQKIMDTGLISVAGDSVRLQQVVWNLISNAIKFTPRGGRVRISLERVNSHVEIRVSDTGAGIEPEFLPFVFDRFRQADQRTTRQYGGLGLGLAIVRHLVELHGGTVRAESAGLGQGSTFTVLLPIAPVYQAEAPAALSRPAARGAHMSYECVDRLDGLRVLVVDDEPDTRELLKAGLSQCGAEVIAAGSAVEAIELLQTRVTDLLISDIGMPDEDGYDLIRRVRELSAENGGKVPAIALTAYARTEDRLQALRAGYQMHVPKPVELAELVAVASSLVQRDI